MTSQDARQGRLEDSTITPDAKKLIEKSKGNVFTGYMLVEVGEEYKLPKGVTGAKLGKPTATNPDGKYKVPVVWANGNATDQDFLQMGIGKKPDEAYSFKVVPYPGSPKGHRLLYLKRT